MGSTCNASADCKAFAGSPTRLIRAIRVGYTAFACLLLFCNVSPGQQTETQVLRFGFEDDTPIGQPYTKNMLAAMTQHVITREDAHSGSSCERFFFQSAQPQVDESRIAITLPQARVFNELTARLWVRSNCQQVRLGMRIRFPHHKDPRTNEPLEVELFGAPYSDFKNWQELVCETSDETMRSRLIRVRQQISDSLNPVRLDEREAYVDQLIVQFQIPAGQSALQLDDLEFGPVVRPTTLVPESNAKLNAGSVLTMENDRIRKNGEPFFPLITLYHAEALDLIARTGVNMIWIRNYDDRPLLTALQGMDIGAIAYPPQPAPSEAILNRSALPTMPEWTSPIWAWIMGINLPASDRQFVTAWTGQVRDADRAIHRPIIADVAADEREYHRPIDLISITRCQLHTSHSSLDHFEDLRGRRSHTLPGKPPMTFVQTEASGALLDYFGDRTNIPIVEPEQILHQGFEAIAAGFKGIGFWKQIPFDTDVPGLKERLDAIRIFSIHARLLEPFIATGRIVEDANEVQVQVDPLRGRAPKASSSPLANRWDRPVNPQGKAGPAATESPDIRATVFHTDHGLLILLVWHEPGAQCVPGPQTATNVRVLIGGIGDVATACEVTPTSVGQSNLAMERIAGGTELTLKEFDQYAAIIVTGTAEEAKSIEKLAWKTRQAAAESFVSLAESKLARVREIQDQLAAVGSPPVLNAEFTFSQAEKYLDQARHELSTGRANDARIASQKAMQSLRSLQRSHWELATASMTAPTSTMEATSFQTLPDHWKLITQLGKSSGFGENRLPSGNFENESALAQPNDAQGEVSWTSGTQESRFTSLRLIRESVSGNSHLSMIVKPEAPASQKAVLVSPPVEVAAGDLIVMSGQVRIPHPLNGPDHRFEIFDTLAGREGAISLKAKATDWTPFRIVRYANEAASCRLRFELLGPGIAEVDNVQVHVLQAPTIQRASN
ncbi:hypothetical protein SH661x_000216 [Planctomicrobium sp. SH661]|uniref:hypothetical protein n=1 Tax=Planctomicrobium sp. SH661 TaxID=3448124 RepID=UPI003F5C76F5